MCRYILSLVILAATLSGCSPTDITISKIGVQTDSDGGLLLRYESNQDVLELQKHYVVQFRCYMLLRGMTNSDILAIGNITPVESELSTGSNTSKYYQYMVKLRRADFMDNNNVTYSLDDERIHRLKCYIIGVMKAPVRFPQSNIIEIYPDEYRKTTAPVLRTIGRDITDKSKE